MMKVIEETGHIVDYIRDAKLNKLTIWRVQ